MTKHIPFWGIGSSLLFFSSNLHAQTKTVQAFTIAAENYTPPNTKGLQFDWRIDLGSTAIELNQSSTYFFIAGMLQPNINRFANAATWKLRDPEIHLRYNDHSHTLLLFSSAPDLIIYGFTLFDANGRLIKTDVTKTASSCFTKFIDLHLHSQGIYYMLVYYLPDNLSLSDTNNYWTKTLKLIK